MSDSRAKTIAAEEAGIRRSKKNTNNTICSIGILVLAIMAVLYMFDLNTIITTVISTVITVLYNGIGSLFGAEVLLIEEVEAVTRTIMAVVLLAAFIGAYWSNRNQK